MTLIPGGPRAASLIVLALGAVAACAKIADLEGSYPSFPADGNGGTLPTTPEGITVSPATLEIATSCGVTSDSSAIAIANTGAVEQPYEVQVPKGSSLTLRDDKGTIGPVVSGVVAPGQVVQVVAVVTSSKPGTNETDVFVTTAGRLQVVKARVTIKGAALSLTPALIDFGEVRQNTAAPPQTVEIENTGNEPVTIEGWTSTTRTADAGAPDFTMSSASIPIQPGQKGQATVTFEPKPAGPEVTAELTPKTTGTLCGDPPKIRLEGTRVNAEVTVSPGGFDFGDVACNAVSNATRTLTISNYSNQDANATVTLPADSWFTILDLAPLTIRKGRADKPTTATITVGLKQLPSTLEDHTEQLSITLTGPETTTKTVSTRVRTVGAILEVTPATLDEFTPGETKEFTIRNTGNKFIAVRVASSNPAAFASGGDHYLYENSPFVSRATVRFLATTPGTHTADITVSRTESPPWWPKSSTLCNAPVVVKATTTKR
jgi:urease beta subunit